MSHTSFLPTVHILYENPAWLPPLVSALEAEGFPIRLVELDQGILDPSATPEEGIWINRISPSSHTRGHNDSVGLAREVLFWLESHGRRVINGSQAFELEVSKFRQDRLLQKHGIRTPKTVLVVGRDQALEEAGRFDGPFITKHNQGGKGLGIQLFRDVEGLANYLDSDSFDPGPNRQLILQEYIRPPQSFITRVEVAFGKFVLAMRSSTEEGFELCPSDACQVQPKRPDVCPADGGSKFSASPVDADDPLVASYISLCKSEGVDVAGIEFVEDAEGNRYTYDINGTTNFNQVLGREIGVDGMREIARGLRSEVLRERRLRARVAS
ncbi:MAG: alpha-L-glutamate ligase [Deltaproteobacteria bacterium]|nr:alpha-L-glutamate ligase [Deltaproteobacteria bacterium]